MSENGDSPYTPSPRPHPRIRPEALGYAERNRGGMEKWFDYSDNVDNYNSARPASRNISAEAQRSADINKGSMTDFLKGYPDPPMQQQVHPRGVRPEASATADMNKGGHMKNLIDNYGNLGLSDRPEPKVKGGEAQEYAQRNNGTVNNVLNNYGNHPVSPAPPQKLGYGGEEVAAKHQGAGMGPMLRMEGSRTPQEVKVGVLHQQSEGGWDEIPPNNRVRPEAEGIAAKNNFDAMGGIMAQSPQNGSPQNGTPPRKPTPKHMMTTRDPRPRTSPARTRPEAMTNYHKNQTSEMGFIMRGESQTVTPQRRNMRMLQRSEDW